MVLTQAQQKELAQRIFDGLMNRYSDEMDFQLEAMKDLDIVDYEAYPDLSDLNDVDVYFDEVIAEYLNNTKTAVA